MSAPTAPLTRPDQFYIGGRWVKPSSDSVIDVIDSVTELPYFTVAEAQKEDMAAAVGAAREAFDNGPWPKMTHAERAQYLTAFGAELTARIGDIAAMWPRESGVVSAAVGSFAAGAVARFDDYAALGSSFAFEERATPTAGGKFGLLVREPVGVVGAIIPWNAPIGMIANKIAPALLAGCTVVLKSAPEAPGEGLIAAEIAEKIGLPPGVLNCVTADREVSELLVTDRRVDKISFTGSTLAGRRIASLCGDRIARCTLELGGKSAAVVLDDADLARTATSLSRAQCFLSGQVCSSLTRIVVIRSRHDELVEALAGAFSQVRVGDPFDAQSQMGPLAAERQRDRVEGYIAKGVEQGGKLVTGGGRPKHLGKGWYVEPTVFAEVDTSHAIAQEEIFGPVLSVIPAIDEDDAIRIANDTIFGLNASVFTEDADRALNVARQIRSGTVGHNAFRTDFGIAFGGFKQSGIGREGGRDGLLPYLEAKTLILNATPSGY
ncbi:MAG TPA: aldehyde dehydrogenase [Pseudonocardia sp.]|jgi:acyl-CoA reductase-like NAD-dependent aldehyde dehydrogenase